MVLSFLYLTEQFRALERSVFVSSVTTKACVYSLTTDNAFGFAFLLFNPVGNWIFFTGSKKLFFLQQVSAEQIHCMIYLQ